MDNNKKWDLRFLDMAKTVSKWSKDPSTQIGAVIVRPDKSIASVGYNGFPMKMEDNPEYYTDREDKYSRIIHAEMNALLLCKDTHMDGFSLYTYPIISCNRCFVHIAQAGITKIIAPKLTGELLERWGEASCKTRQYAAECDIVVVEYDIEDI